MFSESWCYSLEDFTVRLGKLEFRGLFCWKLTIIDGYPLSDLAMGHGILAVSSGIAHAKLGA